MIFQKLCFKYLTWRGWRFVSGEVKEELRSFVMIGAPHTSNYDFITAMAVIFFLKRNARFVIKSEWVRFPFGLIMRPLGALGLNREKLKESQNTTELMANLFQEEKDLVLLISPEGTRSPQKQWKTGFYYIALKANVPIVLGFADHEKKVIGMGKVIYPQNFEQDMHDIMEFYKDIKGKKPKKFRLDYRF